MLKNKEIRFAKEKEIDLAKLDVEVAKAFGYKRHRTSEDKNCYSGLEMDYTKENGEVKRRVMVIWTDDGEHGYVKELTKEEQKKLETIVENHGKPKVR